MLMPLLEQLMNRVLRLDPESLQRLGEFQGKTIAIALTHGAQASPLCYLLPSADGIRLLQHYQGSADVTLHASLPVFIRLLTTGATAELIAESEIEVDGDIELGQRFQRFVRQLHFDWEEELSHIVGDVAAHNFGNLARASNAWRKNAANLLLADVAEYLQEESRMLATPSRVQAFLQAVDMLRADADRLEARIKRLRERAGG